jgi:alginate O-acetyltransferase complex protein AlgI
MLFNSYVFMFAYLPVVLAGYSIAGRFHRKAVVIWLGLASLGFYVYWHPPFVAILAGSILFNFLMSNLISRTLPNNIGTRLLLWFSISGNLALLCWFKYLFPLLHWFSHFVPSHPNFGSVLLPIGISFFTFTQIAYLVDLQQGAAVQQDFFSYLLFVTFFPHLIAGPILHHKDIMPQFQQNRTYRLRFDDLAIGASWFAMGLFKKVGMADNLAKFADKVFAAHGSVSSEAAWVGTLCYSLQLYFDFSGYCDMACGLARMLSIDFPLNFSSPYKSKNIIDFWQRWHMTLTQYIMSYLYTPMQLGITRRRRLAGKPVTRKAQSTAEGFFHMVALPTALSMLLAGIWHGAGSQFLIFGMLHGMYLTVNHAWRIFRHPKALKPVAPVSKLLNHAATVLLTYVCVVVAQVFFRAPNTADALLLLGRIVHLPMAAPTVSVGSSRTYAMEIVLGFIVVWAFPNTQQILARFKPALRLAPADELPRLIPVYWAPSARWGFVLGGMLMYALIGMQTASTFLYFQF